MAVTGMNGDGDRAEDEDARRRFLAVAWRAAKWIVAILIVSLVLPAATKQWSDNQQQRQLRTDVTARLARAVAQATTEGGFLLDNRMSGLPAADLRAAYQKTLVTWKSEASGIDAQLAQYFAKAPNPDNDSLIVAMRAYNRLVQDYLAYCLLYRGLDDRVRFLDDFDTQLGKIRDQMGGEPRDTVTPQVVANSKRAGWSPNETFKEQAQNVWAQEIVDTGAPLITTINHRQARGYQIGVKAFVSQILWPFG